MQCQQAEAREDKLVEMHHQQMEAQNQLMEAQNQQMKVLVNHLAPAPGGSAPIAPAASVPSFAPFDPTSELWKDYRARINTFVGANSIPHGKTAQVFLTNQTSTTYKLLCILAGQQASLKDINTLTMGDIARFMESKFHHKYISTK